MKHSFFEEVKYHFECFLCWISGAIDWEILIKFWSKNDRYNTDLRGTHHSRICSLVFTLDWIEDKCLVNCGGFPGDCSTTRGMRSDFRFSVDEEVLLKGISSRFMSLGVIIVKLLSLILLMVFSNVGSGSNFSTSIFVFILRWSKFSSKDAGILEINNCGGSLTGILFITSVASERHFVFSWEEQVIFQYISILDAVVLWNSSILLLVVQRFD